MKKNILLTLILTSTLWLVTAVKADNTVRLPEIVRVAIVRDSREIVLAIHGAYRLRDLSTGQIIAHGTRLPESEVRLLDRGLLLGLDVYPTKRLTIEPSRDASI